MINGPEFCSYEGNSIKFPQRLSMYFTLRCNMKCPHCLLRLYNPDFFKKEDMELSHAKDILSYYYKRGLKNLTVAALGEVFLYPYLKEIVIFARELGYKPLNTVSNGLILDQYFDLLLENFEFINISLDGYDNKSYAMHRGVDGIFDKVVHNITELVEKREKTSSRLHISLVHVVYEENLYDIEKMIKIAERLKVDRIVFKNFHPVQDEYKACTPLHVKNDKTQEYLSSIMSSNQYRIQILLPSLIGKEQNFCCSNLFNDITIGLNGLFAPCCQIPTEKKYGSFFDEPESFLKDNIFEFKKNFLAAKTHAELPSICRQCQALNLENDMYFPEQKQWRKRYLADNYNFAFHI